jgi:hypothetical protein
MRPTTANDNVFDFNALLHPGTVFEHPRDVVSDPGLTISEKRAILASWASDASAIASCPALRAPDGLKAPVTIDDILEALCALDGGPRNPPGGKPMPALDRALRCGPGGSHGGAQSAAPRRRDVREEMGPEASARGHRLAGRQVAGATPDRRPTDAGVQVERRSRRSRLGPRRTVVSRADETCTANIAAEKKVTRWYI